MFFKKTGRRIIMLVVPTVIMLAVTFSSLVLAIRDRFILILQDNINHTVPAVQMGLALLLLILGIMVAFSCAVKLFEKTETSHNDSE
jgi:carbon starvation protein